MLVVDNMSMVVKSTQIWYGKGSGPNDDDAILVRWRCVEPNNFQSNKFMFSMHRQVLFYGIEIFQVENGSLHNFYAER